MYRLLFGLVYVGVCVRHIGPGLQVQDFAALYNITKSRQIQVGVVDAKLHWAAQLLSKLERRVRPNGIVVLLAIGPAGLMVAGKAILHRPQRHSAATIADLDIATRRDVRAGHRNQRRHQQA